MANFEQVEFRQFDQVQIRTTRNVKYRSHPPDTQLSPKGVWSVAGVIQTDDGHDLILVKQSATIRIPARDVLKVAAYNIKTIVEPLGRLTDGQGRRQGRQEEKGQAGLQEPRRSQEGDL